MYGPTFVEYLGTALVTGSYAFGGNPIFVVAALALAIGLGGKISGGHFNPAVTAWALAAGKIGQSKAIMYILAQLVAALTVWMVYSFVSV
jgi:glycerol uptake facilitator-like aquaporin